MKLTTFMAAAAAIALSGAANATTITFNSLPGGNGSAYTTYSESGYTVTKTSGDAFVGTVYGNPVPDIFFGPYYGSSSTELELTSASGTFTFGGFDYSGNGGTATYSVKGFLGASQLFDFQGSQDGGFVAQLYAGGEVIDRLVFSLTAGGTSANIDNILVESARSVPEPASWAMMIGGFALVGAGMRRRRQSVAFA